MTTTLWLVLALGVFLGFFAGRWSAETFNARYNMSRVWQSRKGYRK